MSTQSKYEDKDKFHDHQMQQYLHFCQATQELLPRREQVNQFFITVIAGLLAILAWVFKEGFAAWRAQALWVGLILCLVGVGLCGIWWTKLAMYRRLSAARFQVIHDLEATLPVPLYNREWDYLQNPARISHDPDSQRLKPHYKGLTVVERLVPLLLCLPYLALAGFIVAQLCSPAPPPHWPVPVPVPLPCP